MSLIDLPKFLTSSNVSSAGTNRAACTTKCQKSCESNSQCGTCQYCQRACQTSCQTQYQLCGGCETSKQCGTCQHKCQTNCESNCQTGCEKYCQTGCEKYSQCGNRESSCNYSESSVTCGKSCQNQAEACTWIVMSPCDYKCQSSCESNCQSSCERNCQSSCQDNCQSSCESNCQSSCEKSCQSTCQVAYQCGTCQSTCQDACQSACQDCQTPCQINSQHVHSLKTYYKHIDFAYHEKYDKCVDDDYIANREILPHQFTKEFYSNGAVYKQCTICNYLYYLRTMADFEWDVTKGSDTSDTYIGSSEWNRFLDLLSLKLSSLNQNSDVSSIKVVRGEIYSASKFNLIIDKLNLLKAVNVPNKVSVSTIILPTSHLNAIRDSLNSVRN